MKRWNESGPNKSFDLFCCHSVEFKDVIHIYWWSKESFRARKIKKKKSTTVRQRHSGNGCNCDCGVSEPRTSLFIYLILSLLVCLQIRTNRNNNTIEVIIISVRSRSILSAVISDNNWFEHLFYWRRVFSQSLCQVMWIGYRVHLFLFFVVKMECIRTHRSIGHVNLHFL